MRETQWRHSIVLSDSSSDSARLPVDLTSVTKFLKGEMWGKSKIPSSSTLMMGMSKLQRESGTAETQTGREIKTRHVTCIAPDGVSLRWDEDARRMQVTRVQPKVTGCRNKKCMMGRHGAAPNTGHTVHGPRKLQ